MAIKKLSKGLSLGEIRKVKGGYKFRKLGKKRASGNLYRTKESALEDKKAYRKKTAWLLNSTLEDIRRDILDR